MSKEILTLDVESTIYKYHGERKVSKKVGHPLSSFNKCVLVGWSYNGEITIRKPNELDGLKELLDKSLVIGFNIKFDLHWLRRLGVSVSDLRIWDCQIAEYMLSAQRIKYASLNDTAERYGLGRKLDIIKNEYWEKGIDTDEIPLDILTDYLRQDIALTEAVYYKQLEIFNVT